MLSASLSRSLSLRQSFYLTFSYKCYEISYITCNLCNKNHQNAHPSVHLQGDLYMQFYGISFMLLYRQSGRWQDMLDTQYQAYPAIVQTAYMAAWKKGKGRLWVLQQCCLEAYCTLNRMSSFIHLQRRCTHQAAWETSASEGRNYTWNSASNL